MQSVRFLDTFLSLFTNRVRLRVVSLFFLFLQSNHGVRCKSKYFILQLTVNGQIGRIGVTVR